MSYGLTGVTAQPITTNMAMAQPTATQPLQPTMVMPYGASPQPTAQAMYMQPTMAPQGAVFGAPAAASGQVLVSPDGTPVAPDTYGRQGNFGTTPLVNTHLTEGMLGLPRGAAQALMGMPMAPEKPKGLVSYILSGVLKTGAIGAAAGGVAGLVLPFLGTMTGVMIGGIGGAILGAVQAVGKHKSAQTAYQNAVQANNPGALGPEVGVDPYTPANASPAPKPTSPADEPAPPAPAKKRGSRTYVVRSGDTTSAIAKRHRVSLGKLVEANHMTMASASRIRPGQKLVIPRADER